MNEKRSLQDIINLFGEKQGMNKKDAELFVRTMFDLIEEALATEKYVKVKGFGTFKLTEVESRESVNVNTGERIEIQGHTKVSFTPDTTMKDLINKPFAHFETVILNEGVELEDTPVETPETLETPEEVAPIAETPIPEEVPVQEETLVQEAPEPMVEEPVQEEIVPETIVVEEPLMIEEPQPEMAEEAPIQEKTPLEEAQSEVIETPKEEKPIIIEEKKEKTTNRILWGIIVVLVLIILFGAYWMFLRPAPAETSTPPVSVIEDIAIPDTTEVIMEDTIIPFITYQKLSAEELSKERIPSLADTLECEIVGTQTTHTLQKGETIIKASVRFFGTKKYWPYIVKHNMDVLKDPDNIPAGTEIKIPQLTTKNKEGNKQK